MKHSGPKERARTQLYLKDTLHGHTAPVTCLATSANYNLIVSGSKVSSLSCHTLKGKRWMIYYTCTGHGIRAVPVKIEKPP